ALGVHIASVAMDSWALAPAAVSRLRIDAVPTGPEATSISRRAVVDLTTPAGDSVWHWDGPLVPTGAALTYRATVVVPPDAVSGVYQLQVTPYEAASDGPARRVLRIAEPITIGSVDVTR